MNERRFNPLIAPNPEGLGPVLPNARLGIPSWVDHSDSWWAGATIGYPDLKGALAAHTTLKKVVRLGDRLESGISSAADEMHEMYLTTTHNCRTNLLRVLETPHDEATVILETSGTSALSLVRHLLPLESSDIVVTTTEEGNLVKPALMGRDPWNYPKSAFYENVQLYTTHRSTSPTSVETETNKVSAIDLMENGEWKSNTEILEEIRSYLTNENVACLVIPLVTKTGRLLPVKEIGYEVKKHNLQAQRPVTYIVDAIQALGRTDAESIANPLEHCDAFVSSSSKALGGILIASAIVAKPDFVARGLPHLLDSSYAEHLRFYQFDANWSDTIDPILAQRDEHQAISLPEIASFSSVLENHLHRGQGSSYSEQRNNQLAQVTQNRLEVLAALEQIPQVLLLNDSAGAPLVPSIITWKAHPDVPLPARRIKELLQDPVLGHSVILSASVGQLLRLEIPEYRPLPHIEKLSNKLELVFEGK